MSETLFNRPSLGNLIGSYPRAIQAEVDGWERNKALAASESDLIDYLVAKYFLDAPTLLPREQWESVADEVAVDVSHDRMRVPFRDGRRILIPGHRVAVRVPFDGDGDLFDFQPSTRTFNPPRATVSKRDSALTFTVTVPHDTADAERVREDIDREVAKTDSYLACVRQDCAGWNARLPGVAGDCLDLLGQLGIPLKRRDVADDTFSVPVARRTRPNARVPATPRAAFQPEPYVGLRNRNAKKSARFTEVQRVSRGLSKGPEPGETASVKPGHRH